MHGVKGVKAVLYRPVGIAAPAIVEPEGQQRRQRPQFDGHAAHNADAEHRQSHRLRRSLHDGAAGHAADTVEQHHQQHTPAPIVRPGQLQQAERGGHGRAGEQKGRRRFLSQRPIDTPADQRTGQQRPQHVLGIGIPHRAAHHQVEGDFGQQGKHQ